MKNQNAHFICGCCGAGFFDNIKKQREYDQDKGYGICDRCAGLERKWCQDKINEGLSKLRAELNERNQILFDHLSQEERNHLYVEAIKNGVLGITIIGG